MASAAFYEPKSILFRIHQKVMRAVRSVYINLKTMESFGLHQQLEGYGVVLSFKGTVTEQVTSGALDVVERYLEARNEVSTVRKKVFNVMVECLHNLFHHPAPRQLGRSGKLLPERSSIFYVRVLDTGYEIGAGNYVDNTKLPQLRTHVADVSSCAYEQLRRMYRDVMANEERSERGGSGLGLIDIARKSGNPLSCSFHPVDELCSFFSLTAHVSTP